MEADELARHNPNIKISTNAPSAIAQLNLVAGATKRLQDAQGAERVAQAKLTDLQAKGTASASQLRAAEERVQKAHRATATALIALAAAHDTNDRAMVKAAADTAKARVETDALGVSARKTGDSFKIGLIPALLAIAPAAVPIAGVATGALLGLVPVAATVVLGIKGISNEFKSGALDGTKYGADINSLKGELTSLQTIAAGGLLSGIDQGLAASKGLFGEVNSDVQVMSDQLGAIVAGAGPALLQILTDLNPLFVTFGNLISNGAQHLEDWANNSTGVQSFVAYVQAELPDVMTFLERVIILFSHLAQGAAPFGGVLLNDINAFVGALDKIPVGVLQTAIPLAVALYAAFKTYGAVTAAVKGVTLAVNSMKAPFATTAAVATSSAAATNTATAGMVSVSDQATVAIAANEAVQARARAAEAEAAAVAAEANVTADNAISLAMANAARATALAAASEATSMEAAAEAAAASATVISESSTAAADTVVAEGEVASAGWTAMLGPIGAVAVGIALLSTMFLGNKKAAQDAAAAADSYAQSVKTSTDALALANVQQTNDNLVKKGAITILDQLNAANKGLGLSQTDLDMAVNGSGKQFDAVSGKLKALISTSETGVTTSGQLSGSNVEMGRSASQLLGILTGLRAGLASQILTQKQLNALNEASAGVSDHATQAAAKLYGLVGDDGVAAYLAAQQAAQQSTQQAKAQTLQWQLENDAGSLLAQTLDKLAGKNLGYAQAQNSFDSALSNMGTHVDKVGNLVKFTTASINNMSAASVELRGQLLGQVTSAEQTAEAYGKMKGSSEAGRLELIKLRQEIINNAAAHGVDRVAVTRYIDTLLKIPKSVPPTKLQVDKSQAESDLAAFRREVEAQQWIVHINAVYQVAHGGVANLGRGVRAMAAGGPVTGPGPTGVDSVPILGAPGEFMMSDKAVSRYGRGFFAALNNLQAPKLSMPAAGGRSVAAAASAGPSVSSPTVNVAPKVYVENPFTGEYLLAKVAGVVDGSLSSVTNGLAYGRVPV